MHRIRPKISKAVRFVQFVSNVLSKNEDALFSLIEEYPHKIKLAQRLIKNGLGINHEDALNTVLHIACERGYTDWICMLLYYGADPNIPTCIRGLPITTIGLPPGQDREFLRDILSPYTIDNRSLSLPTLIAAMREETSWFCKVLENVSEVVYDEDDEDFVYDNMIHARPSNIKLFLEKFPRVFQYISEDLVANGFLYLIIKEIENHRFQDNFDELCKDFIDIFLYNSCISKLSVSDLKQWCYFKREDCFCPYFIEGNSMIFEYVQSTSGRSHLPEDEITERVLLMMTHGLGVTVLDLEVVYTCYGYCDLFEILLHMDPEVYNLRHILISPLILLYHDPRLTIESCFGDPPSLMLLLDLYNDTNLKELCLALIEDYDKVVFTGWYTLQIVLRQELVESGYGADWYVLKTLNRERMLNKLLNMSKVSSLMELSRNVARKYIVDKFKIRTSRELHTILNGLPIDKITKDTIKLRRKLY